MWKCLGGRSILFHVSREAVRALNARLFSSEKSSDKKYRNADYPSLNEPLLPPAVCGSAGLGWNRLVIRWGQLAALCTARQCCGKLTVLCFMLKRRQVAEAMSGDSSAFHCIGKEWPSKCSKRKSSWVGVRCESEKVQFWLESVNYSKTCGKCWQPVN